MTNTMHQNIPAMFFAQVKRFGQKTALLHKVQDRYQSISWDDLATMVREVSCGLIGLGVKPGDRVAIMSYNRPEWIVADLAIMSAGAITVPIYHTSSRKEADFVLGKAGVDVAFVARSEKAEMLTTCDAAIKNIISLDPVGIDSAGSCSIDYSAVRLKGKELLKNEGGAELEKRLAAIAAGQCATIIFTSGTTGNPKGVMLSHRNILANAAAALEAQRVGPEDVFLSFLPLSHSFERTAGQFLMLLSGAVTAYAQSLRNVAENIQEVRPTVMLGVPRFYEKLYARIIDGVQDASASRQKIFRWAMDVGRQMMLIRIAGHTPGLMLRLKHRLADRLVFSKLRQRLGGRLKFFVSGGAPLAKEIAEFFLAGGVQILEGYGLTEFSPVIAVNRLGSIRPGTVGNPLPGCEVRIFEDGEIGVRGPSVMLGYYNDEAATAEVIRDGWLLTGDLGELENNYLKILDRKKDIIVTSGGKNISPQYIENLIRTDEYISQVVLYGERRNFLTALVVPDYERFAAFHPLEELQGLSPGQLADHPQMREFLLARMKERTAGLAPYETVRKIVVLPEPLSEAKSEVTPTMKIRKKAVIKKYQPQLDALYEDGSGVLRSLWP